MLKKRLFPLILLFGVLIPAAVFWYTHWPVGPHAMVLDSGEIIAVDGSWTIGETVVYLKDNRLFRLSREAVVAAGAGNVPLGQSGEEWVGMHLKSLTAETMSALVVQVLPWLWGALGVAVLWRCLFVRRRKDPEPPGVLVGESPGTASGSMPQPAVMETDEDRIIAFFLNLYRLQLQAPDSTVVRFEKVGTTLSGGNRIYELSVWVKDEWVRRRMTIGLIGEDSGAKSKCFYVIFDVHLVVKIPHRPITDFSVYSEAIRKERAIVEKLAPRECIIPKVSVILKRIRKFQDEQTTDPAKIEDRYSRWVANSAEAQSFLKIGGSFVFFMDLSQYVFLGYTIVELHDIKVKAVAEICGNPTLIWDAQGFSARYGQGSSRLCFELQEIYSRAETAINSQKMQDGEADGVPPYQIKEGFLKWLADREVLPRERKISADHAAIMNEQFGQLFRQYDRPIKAYRGVVDRYTKEIVFRQNIRQTTGIITNLMDLLQWLGTRQVALRDLKPDNLLVAGDKSQYPDFLKYPERFSIGLIDVETAVDFGPGADAPVQQPQLGGTPFYATPSHLLQNRWIENVLGDPALVFHLQDWHATVAIIYKLVFGEPVFELTGRLLPGLRKTIQKRVQQKETLEVVVGDVSRIFWNSARKEFDTKTRRNRSRLEDIQVLLSKDVRAMLKAGLDRTEYLAEKHFLFEIEQQPFFPGEKNRRQLLAGTSRQLMKLVDRFESRKRTSAGRSDALIRWLKRAVNLKKRIETIADIKSSLPGNQPLTLLAVMSALFDSVYFVMMKPEWGVTDGKKTVVEKETASETTYEVTIEADAVNVQPIGNA